MKDNFVEIWYGDILHEQELSEQKGYNCTMEKYWSLLSPDEQKKAEKYSRMDIKQKYIKTRAILRKILAGYLHLHPKNLIFNLSEHGKPFLADQNLFFNLSHTGNRFVIALCPIFPLGIDLEQIRDRTNLSGIAKKCFAEVEIQYWNTLSSDQKILQFYRFWVSKEAFVKAVGRGISLGLDQCIINPKDQSSFLSIPKPYGLPSDWKIVDIELQKDDICALVTQQQNFTLKTFEYKD